jgi:hypothetical protein
VSALVPKASISKTEALRTSALALPRAPHNTLRQHPPRTAPRLQCTRTCESLSVDGCDPLRRGQLGGKR